jgi:hypothetical protein
LRFKRATEPLNLEEASLVLDPLNSLRLSLRDIFSSGTPSAELSKLLDPFIGDWIDYFL